MLFFKSLSVVSSCSHNMEMGRGAILPGWFCLGVPGINFRKRTLSTPDHP